MKLKLLIILNGIILISFLSCNGQNKKLTSDFLIGKWSQFDGETTENGITKRDFTLSSAIKYDFNENGTISLVYETPNEMEWKLNEQNNLLIGIDKNFAEYKPKIETDSTMILSRDYKGKTFSYYFKKGWSD